MGGARSLADARSVVRRALSGRSRCRRFADASPRRTHAAACAMARPSARLRALRAVAAAAALSWRATPTARAFPLFYGANGSALLTSVRGGDVVLQPDAGGAVVATSLVRVSGAGAGVMLNSTLLDEAFVAALLAVNAELSAQVAALQASLAALTPQATCWVPDALRADGGGWISAAAQEFTPAGWRCVCWPGWSGADCSTPPAATPPSPLPPCVPPDCSYTVATIVDNPGWGPAFGIAAGADGYIYWIGGSTGGDTSGPLIRFNPADGSQATTSAMISQPHGVMSDAVGNIYVGSGDEILRVNLSSLAVTDLGIQCQAYSFGVAPSGQQIYCANYLAATVYNISYADGAWSSALLATGTPYPPDGQTAMPYLPSASTFDPLSGNVYVGDANSDSVCVIRPSESSCVYYAGPFPGLGPTPYPMSLAVDQAGTLYVGASDGGVYMVTTSGENISILTGLGTRYGGVMAGTSGIAIRASGVIYAADFYGGMIRTLSPSRA
jgi:hypothetical protein